MNPSTNLLHGVGRIAVLRANGIGDFLFALPALEALRGAYGDAEITFVGGPWHAELLQGRPGPVDRVVVTPPSRGVWWPPGAEERVDDLDRFFGRMQAEEFDLALQLHGGGRWSNPFTRRLGARVTAGLRDTDAEPLDRWVRYVYFQSEVLRYLEVVRLVGADGPARPPRLAVLESDRAEAASVVAEGGGPLVVLNPGARDPRRQWPVEKLAAAGDALAGAGAEVVVSGAEADVVAADEVVATMSRPARSVAGRLSLRGLAGLLSRAAVVVSNDSGPLHLAAAVGASTVGVYWCNNVVMSGPVAAHRHRMAISWRVDCPLCGADSMKGACEHRVSFVAEVPVEQVVEEAMDLLDGVR